MAHLYYTHIVPMLYPCYTHIIPYLTLNSENTHNVQIYLSYRKYGVQIIYPLKSANIININERLLCVSSQLRGCRAGELRPPPSTHPLIQVQSEPLNLSEKDIILDLKRIDTAGFQNYEEICSHDNFDVIYHLIKYAYSYSGDIMKI